MLSHPEQSSVILRRVFLVTPIAAASSEISANSNKFFLETLFKSERWLGFFFELQLTLSASANPVFSRRFTPDRHQIAALNPSLFVCKLKR
jgi:hypothetical protein